MKQLLLLVFLTFTTLALSAQPQFSVTLEPVSIPGLGGIQSFAFGTANGKWLVVGGRLDGLHRRQPWASFDLSGHNNLLVVIDPETEQRWTASLVGLSASLQEQMSSTNMQFHQEGNTLYLVGGYGYSATAGDHMTFPYLTAIEIAEVIDAVINTSAYSTHLRQIEDPQFAVTGGRLLEIEETYYLVGGHKFDGRYNPMDHPSFTQTYTDAIRRFEINDNGSDITVTHLDSWIDSDELHRRDFNVVPQVFPDGSIGATAFSGVFQEVVDLPFLNSVDITSDGYTPTTDFNQLFNHYHCPTIPIYSPSANAMHTLFFGGMAQFYISDGDLVQDDDVPFVRSIAAVSRSSEGNLQETLFPTEMPGYLGAGAEFIPIDDAPTISHGILNLDELEDSHFVGYIFGGINSTADNIFWINDGTQSSAHSMIYKVYIVKENSTGVAEPIDAQGLLLQVFPNPTSGDLHLEVNLPKRSSIKISVYDYQGQLLIVQDMQGKKYKKGTHQFDLTLTEITKPKTIMVILETETDSATQKVLLY